jgi:hypothetical protein
VTTKERFSIRWDAQEATYKVSIPNYEGGYVVRADAYDDLRHAFKNFHRLLCERFGYGHDEKDWQRDQLSLIEWIANSHYTKQDVEAICAIAISGRQYAETLAGKTDAIIEEAKRAISKAIADGSGVEHGTESK